MASYLRHPVKLMALQYFLAMYQGATLLQCETHIAVAQYAVNKTRKTGVKRSCYVKGTWFFYV